MRWRRCSSLVLVALVVAGCSSSGYFDQPSAFAESGAATPGTLVYAGVANLNIKPGDSVEFIRLDSAGPDVTRVLVAPLARTSGMIGVARGPELDSDTLAAYQPLGGAAFTSTDGPLGVLAEIRTPASDVDIVKPVLVYRVNGGGEEREPLLVAVRICSRPSEADPCQTPAVPKP